MTMRITFKNMDSSDALRTYAEKKIGEKVQKLLYKPAVTELTLSVERHNNSAHIIFNSGKVHLEATDVSSDMYASIDNVASKLDFQIKKHIGKAKDYSKAVPISNLEINDEYDHYDKAE